MSRAEAEKMYSVRLKQTQQYLQTLAPGPVPVPAPNDTFNAPATRRIFHVTDYGADPTGASDSTEAIMMAIIDAFSLSTEYELLPGISDFGGAEIHLDGGNYKLSAPLRLPGGSGNVLVVKGVNIVDNAFYGSGNTVPIIKLNGSFDSVEQTVVDRNNASGMNLKSTAARGTVKGNGTTWTLDFSPFLGFPDLIQHVQYSFYSPVESSFPRHALRNVSNNKVVVESDVAVPATVAVMVDQSATFIEGQGICS